MSESVRKITHIPGALLTPPAGGWEGCHPDVFYADANLLGRLRELARLSVSDPGCPPEMETHRTLREVPAAELLAAIARIRRTFPHWQVAGTEDQSIWDRLDEHYAIPQRRAQGIAA